jgi:hypothetical protein
MSPLGGRLTADRGKGLSARCRRRGLASITSMVMLVLLGATLPAPVSARVGTKKPTIEQLEKEIRQRDAIIRNLVRRVENLERQAGAGDPVNANQAGPSMRSAGRSRGRARPSDQTEVAALEPEEPASTRAGQARTPSASSAGAPQQQARSGPPAPGQFSVSEEDAERALERTLVATGNLLVPSGFAEVEPLFSYARREIPTQVLFNLNRNEFNWALGMRFGLPWESQFEIAAPYNLVQQQVTDIAVAPPQQVSNRWGNSFGDVTVGLAKTFVHESGWVPDLLGRVSYEIPTGPENSNQVPLPSRRNNLAFSLTGTKRQDPLVFVATGGYTKAFQTGQLNPGDQINFQTGAFLGTSPETTLRGVLQENFIQNIRVNDATLKGSDTVQSILNFGASSILGRNWLVDLQVGLGLTNAAPKYSVILSSTYRFGMPWP